tara:strand:- start:1035 stop:1385 length:351 start_codon:yes stop_codon:yes gene_type:complete
MNPKPEQRYVVLLYTRAVDNETFQTKFGEFLDGTTLDDTSSQGTRPGERVGEIEKAMNSTDPNRLIGHMFSCSESQKEDLIDRSCRLAEESKADYTLVPPLQFLRLEREVDITPQE